MCWRISSAKGRKKLLFYTIMELKSLQFNYLNYIMVGQNDDCVITTLLVNIARQVNAPYNFLVVWVDIIILIERCESERATPILFLFGIMELDVHNRGD